MIKLSWRYPFFRRIPRITIGDLGYYEYKEPPIFDEAIRYKRWVVTIESDTGIDAGILGVVDHVKPNGQLGVRPVDQKTASYWPNSSRHWAMRDRLRIPEEWALYESEVRNATEKEIPKVIRRSQ